MRISSTIPSYKPSYSAANLPQPQAQETPSEPVFAGHGSSDGVTKTGTNWKKQLATVGLLTMTAFTEQAQAASVANRVSDSRSRSSSDVVPTGTAVPEVPGVNLDHNLLHPVNPVATMPEAVKTQEKKREQTKAEQKKAEAKKLEAQKEEDKKAEAKFLAQKNALVKRDGDASKVCKAPDGTVVIASWWSSTGTSAHG